MTAAQIISTVSAAVLAHTSGREIDDDQAALALTAR